MTDSMYFSLMAAVFIAPHIGPKAGFVMWGLSVVTSFVYMGRT